MPGILVADLADTRKLESSWTSGLFGTKLGGMDDHLKQLLALAREHYEKSEFDKAEYLLSQVLSKTDRFADVYNMLGVIAHSRGDFAKSEGYFEKAISLNPNYTEAQLNLMVAYNDLGKYDDARLVYTKIRNLGSGGAAQADPFAKGKIANMHADISQAYQDAGLMPEALLELEKAVSLCPTFADLRTRLAVIHRDAGDTARAKEQLSKAKEVNPNYVQARILLAAILLSEGDKGAAVAELEAALQIEPENKNAKMYLRIANATAAKPPDGGGDPQAK
jgi:tetratricopeptide (TPR) repeat protein